MAEQDASKSSWQLSLAIGAGVRTNPIQYSSNIPLVLLPQLNYSRGNFFIDNLDMGLHFYESKQQQVNLLVTPSYDQIFFDRWNSGNFFVESTSLNAGGNSNNPDVMAPPLSTQNPVTTDKNFVDRRYQLHDREMTALGGLEYNLQLDEVNLQLQWLHDLLNKHDGQEVRVSLGREWQMNRHTLNLSTGLLWQDAKTLNYYYGISAEEAAVEDIYQPDAGISPMLSFDWHYRLTENWDLRFFSSYRYLDDEIKQSPIVNDNKIMTVFVGGVYHF